MLENINSIDDLKKLTVAQLPQLCTEIRQLLIDTVSHTGGHLSSNLGVVELTVALHYVYDQCDSIVWDVGHQSYIHKILTGRKDQLSTIRQQGGISGFCDPAESGNDCVISGHASTSVSSAIGLATATALQQQTGKIVAVVGDGALTGGMIYEALNNIRNNNMLIILNDNNMSIGKNVGALSKSLSRLRVGSYYKNKQKLKKFLHKIPLIGKPLYRFSRWIKRHLKFTFLNTTYFDHYKVKYIGIVDGHEIKDLVYYLSKIKENIHVPTLLHIITQKGKGYAPAENDQALYHNYPTPQQQTLASDIVGKCLIDIATANNKVVAITAAMSNGVGLDEFQKEFPDRFFDVGIAEQHAVTFAGGLATKGIKPYVLIYSTFLQRAYDQLIHDISIANLPVVLLLDRAGFVGSDGKTHQGLQDLSYLSSIPNMTIWTPYCNQQLIDMIAKSQHCNHPIAIRYSKVLSQTDMSFDGSWNVMTDKSNIKILAVGANMVDNALQAQKILAQYNIAVEVVAVTTVKPLDTQYIESIADNDLVITVEENQLLGGFGSQLHIALQHKQCKIVSMGVDDSFVAHATVGQQIQQCQLAANDIVETIKNSGIVLASSRV